MDAFHRRLIEIGLSAAAQHGFALAGGYAVQAHDVVDRVSEDVDLFAPYERRAEMNEAAEHTIQAYRAAGLTVDTEVNTETYVRLWISDPTTNPTADPEYATKVELVATPLVHAPVQLSIGPVLHRDDIATGKMGALYTRAAARDYIDVASLLIGGHYTAQELIDLATADDVGFDKTYFAQMLARITRFDDEDFLRYQITPAYLHDVRTQIAAWHRDLTEGNHDGRPRTSQLRHNVSPSAQPPQHPPSSMPGPSLT
ncbi:nucleotidyl transferase AbiEii/AbiGii toxin family protein [Phytoactinopolyspora halotolerans]|uniref:Nucleotidyl transferase AbiEii/AbiGii toxin family protein n=1 Tax=Phytoactinopolyspora halotolerans TaxID=1981512 RepID=A0A6L9SGU4_9ACTN|nr:nucleotidyl transferase AbiEii/AbiGii toxin family protein [Phytoactinopolyspora halotolerans]NEE03844.1 nucleotidyl transferase AbiEii/AbiGii toxin family protein [Phytoactinopolyspora halotolerans]